MPITSSAKKAVSVAKRRLAENQLKKEAYKQAVKNARKAISAKDAKASELLTQAQSTLDRAVKTHILHRNTASRLMSRLSKHAPSAIVQKKRTVTKSKTTKKASVKKK